MRSICSLCKRRYYSRAENCVESSVTISGGYNLIIGAGKSMVIRPSVPLGEHCPNCKNILSNTIDLSKNRNPSIVILFGAGASHGSAEHDTPPLGTELFKHLVEFDPKHWGSIPQKINSIFQNDFEEGMKALINSYANKLPPLQRSMAEFFFQFKLSNHSLYKQLCQKIKNKNISIGLASLNYERLLELAISESGYDLDICLPHGCCNIFCDAASTIDLGAEFAGTGLTTIGDIYSINDESHFKQKIDHDSFPPVMSYFEPEKRVTSGTNFIKEQKQKWASLCNSAKEIYVIGVNPKESDRHIWEPLKQTQAKIIYCGGVIGGEIFEKWSNSANRLQKDIILKGYFQYEFENICNLIGI